MDLPPLPHSSFQNTGMQLWNHIRSRLQDRLAAGQARRRNLKSHADLETHAQGLRAFLLQSFGGWPSSENEPPEAREMGRIARPNLEIRKVVFQVRPEVWATAHYYVSTHSSERRPGVLLLCGHSANGKSFSEYQCVAQTLAQAGLAVLVLDTWAQGERISYRGRGLAPGSTQHERAGHVCRALGQNLARYMLHDARRALDFLENQPEVDPSRLAVTGNSGGGLQTSLLMNLDSRLSAAAIGSFISSLLAIFDTGIVQDAEQIWSGFAQAGYDHADLLAAFAPKPLCVLANTADFFPIEGTRETVEEVSRLWRLDETASHTFRCFEEAHTHAYTPAMARYAAAFFREHFGVTTAWTESPVDILSDDELACLPPGGVESWSPASLPLTQEIQQAYRTRPIASLAEARAFLSQAVFAHRQTIPLEIKIISQGQFGTHSYQMGTWWSQPGLTNSAALLRPSICSAHPVTRITLWGRGMQDLPAHTTWVEQTLRQGHCVLVVNFTGCGPLAPHPCNAAPIEGPWGTISHLTNGLFALSDSLAALRVYEALRACQAARIWPGCNTGEVHLHAEGQPGLYAILASFLDPTIHGVECQNPPKPQETWIADAMYDDSWAKSLVIPGLLSLSDWPDLAQEYLRGRFRPPD